MNYLWGFMMLAGIVYASFHGTLPEVTQAAVDSSKEAVTLCITMTGVMSLWVGLMRIAEHAGIISGAVRMLKPFLHFLFPNLPKNHPARDMQDTFYCGKLHCKYFWAGMGGDACGLKSDGGTGKSGRGAAHQA